MRKTKGQNGPEKPKEPKGPGEPTFTVVGAIQGTRMDCDKFYDVAWKFQAKDSEEAKQKAEAMGVFVERVIREPEEDQNED